MDIHVFEKSGSIDLIGDFKEFGPNTYESRSWKLSDDKANNLIDGKIFMHKSKKTKSWFGGRIVSWKRVKSENDRVVIRFIHDEYYRDTSPPDHWPRQDFVVV